MWDLLYSIDCMDYKAGNLSTNIDVLIIGGGPAGASAAILLARAGWSVTVIEKKIFPRSKVCGEFLSATSAPLLQELGVLDFYTTHAGPPVRQVGWYAANKVLTTDMPVANNAVGQWGRALGRDQLDTALLDEARRHGAHVWQPWNAESLTDHATHFTCQIKNKDQTASISARLVIMAHGSWERPLIKTVDKPHHPADLLAFKAHFNGSQLAPNLMVLLTFPGGYGGLVHSDQNRVTLSCCIRRDRLQKIRARQPGLAAGDAVLNHIISSCAGAAAALTPATRDDQWLSVGPIRPGIRTCYAKGIFYVGNMAGEAHPIIAEGISMAMQSAWLLAESLLAQPSMQRSELDKIGQLYTKRWHAQFANRIRLAAFLARVTTRPAVMKLLLPLVARFPWLLRYGAALSGKIKEVIQVPAASQTK